MMPTEEVQAPQNNQRKDKVTGPKRQHENGSQTEEELDGHCCEVSVKLLEMNAKLNKVLTLFGEIKSLNARFTNLEEENKQLKEAANLTKQDITGLKTTQVYMGANMDKNTEEFPSLEKKVLMVWGKVGSVQPPHLVLLIMVEPTKPTMCHDEHFVNFWIKDLPLLLDNISGLPRYVFKSHFQTTFNDKSGYDHVKLLPDSFTFVGLEWKGWYFCYKTLPFGWKASLYVYHMVGLAATCNIRSLGVPCSQYIDDRHVGQLALCQDLQDSLRCSSFQLAEAAAFIVCSILAHLGYFIGLSKSCSPD